MRRLPVLVFAVTALAAVLGTAAGRAAQAATPPADAPVTGLWNRDDGLGGVRIAPCGDALCGDVVWLKNPNGPAHVGERLLFDLHKTATATWSGSALNPEDGGTYAGTLELDGDHLTTRGCAAFGLICRSVGLTRAAAPPNP